MTPLNLAVRMGDTLVSPVLPLCGTMLVTGGSPNVIIVKKPAMSLGDTVIQTPPPIMQTYPNAISALPATYAATSGGVVLTAVTSNDAFLATFNWIPITIPAPAPGSGSKTVFINKKPAMRVCDPILPLTFQFIATQPNVFIGG